MKRIISVLKTNFKIILALILGMLLAGTGVYAATTLASSSVAYDNTTSGGSSTNVKGALDELYKKSKDHFPIESTFANKILANNTIITATPTLTASSNNTSDASGLYKSTATNSGTPTYYFRGAVTNNYVEFAGLTWRIIRINEDGTVRIILSNVINDSKVSFSSTNSDYHDTYYSNSDVKEMLETWFNTNIVDNGYSDMVSSGGYFCEQAKVGSTVGNVSSPSYSNYTSNFKCSTDANGYGIVNSSIGLITYDEINYAGGFRYASNSSYYLAGSGSWSMSPLSDGVLWTLNHSSGMTIFSNVVTITDAADVRLRPVINIKADATVTGSGIVGDEYVIQ